MNDTDIAVVDTEGIGADLRNDGFHALANGCDASDHLDDSVELDFYAHSVEWSKSALLNKHSHAGADFLALLAARAQSFLKPHPISRFECRVEQQRVVAGVVGDFCAESVESERVRHGALTNEIALANLYGVDADLRGNRVHQPLADKGGFVGAGRAIRATGRFVCEANVADGTISRHAIRPWQHCGGEIRHSRGVRAHISAVVVKEFVFDSKDVALRIDRSADAMILLARMIGGDQMFAAVLYPFDWTFEFQRCGTYQNVFGINLAANAEPAAHVAFVEVDGFFFPSP